MPSREIVALAAVSSNNLQVLMEPGACYLERGGAWLGLDGAARASQGIEKNSKET